MSHYIKLYLHLFLVLFIMSDIFIDLYFGSISNEKKNQHTPSAFILKSVPGSVRAARWAESSCSAAVSEAEAEAEQSAGPSATMSEEHYLELCENPVQFENASSVNNVFFDEANKQVS